MFSSLENNTQFSKGHFWQLIQYHSFIWNRLVLNTCQHHRAIIQCIVTKVQTRKQTDTLSMSLYKVVMYLECSPFLEKERDGGGLIAPMCPFVSFFILPWLAGKCPFVTMHCSYFRMIASKLGHKGDILDFRCTVPKNSNFYTLCEGYNSSSNSISAFHDWCVYSIVIAAPKSWAKWKGIMV